MTLAALLAFGVTGSVTALIMFVFAAFVVGVLGQELWRGVGARRAMTSEGPARALVSLVRRNRRRYGGYTVHLGMAVLFVGVAASSAFQHARDVRLAPGQTATVGGYQVTYVRSTARVDERDGGVERVALGADLRVRKNGSKVADLHTERGYYPASAPFASGGLVRGLFEGEATSEVGMKAGLLRDVWTVIQPDPEYLSKVIAGVAERTADKPVAQQENAVQRADGRLPARRHPGAVPPARLAAGGVDLDRRPDRLRRRADRAVAGARRGAGPGAGRLRRARGAGPGPRVGAPAAWTSWPR